MILEKHNFLIFGLVAGIAIGFFAFGPIYAIVEPHITITMDPGQTTKPFVINDDTGSEVFSVNPDGSFFAANVAQLHFGQNSEVSVAAGDVLATPKILARWNIIHPAGEEAAKRVTWGSVLTAVGIRDSGSNTIRLVMLTSVDNGSTWSTSDHSVFGFGSSFSASQDTQEVAIFSFPNDLTDLAFAAISGDGATTGRWKEIESSVIIFLPSNYKVVRVV